MRGLCLLLEVRGDAGVAVGRGDAGVTVGVAGGGSMQPQDH